ncbi:MAG: trypsin-like peptidase domain-containing protein [Sedimentisphaerales bacterium]|nr:trypsin-like peptidase domain-containing protein [Sedimentisphaerales bacterium]
MISIQVNHGIYICFLLIHIFLSRSLLRAEDIPDSQSAIEAIEQVTQSIVYLEFEQPVIEIVDGKEVEIWYRSEGRFIPKIQKTIGTGFLFQHNDRSYVVTAKHLLPRSRNGGTLYINTISDAAIPIRLEDIQKRVPFAQWFCHNEADIAMHPIVTFESDKPMVRFLHPTIIKHDKPELRSRVIVAGFPHGIGFGEGTISPLVEESYVLNWPSKLQVENLAKDVNYIFLRPHLDKGYSGSPVLTLRGSPSRSILSGHSMQLIGIHIAYITDPSGDKRSVVVPATYLIDILESEDFRRYEKARQETLKEPD